MFNLICHIELDEFRLLMGRPGQHELVQLQASSITFTREIKSLAIHLKMSLHGSQSTSYLSYPILVSEFTITKIDKIQLRQGNIIHCILLTTTSICKIV